nr:hypothetical protein CFP56_28414 [Quercus suber]
MKASGSCVRFPSYRAQARDMDDHGSDERRTKQQLVKDGVRTAYGGGRGESDNRAGVEKSINDNDDKCINDNNVNKGLVPEILLVNPVNYEVQSTEREVMEKSTLDETVRPSRDGPRELDGPTKENGSNRP